LQQGQVRVNVRLVNRNLRLVSALAALTLTVPALAACGSSDEDASASGDQLVVATTVAPITSIAAAVGGDKVQIKGIVPEGTNSHTFEPAPKVAELLSTADIVFVNGLQLEEPTLDLAAKNKKDGSQIVEIGTEILPESDYLYDFSFPEEDGKPNPHLWTDPTYAIKYADVIRATLAERDPENADYYAANAAAFSARATELSDAVKADQKSVPDGGLKLLTYHDAYAYFADTYGWDVIGAVQPKDFEDPSAKEVARIIDQVKDQDVKTVFGSEVFPSKVLEQIGAATGARYEDTLRDDDLPGEPGADEHSWLGLMRYNYVTMITGLGGTADQLEKISLTGLVPDEANYPQ
jgi:ABC-type Zn uptake system ZnuABC Zn-binding protein ZnuA